MRRQIALTLARTPGLHQHLTHLLERDRSGDHPKADVVADTHAGWQCGGSSTHGAYSPPVHSRLGDRSRYVNRIVAWPGHPRLAVPRQVKSWIAGTRAAMTRG